MVLRRERLIREKYGAWCEGCQEYKKLINNGPLVRTWTRRHVKKTGHTVNIIYTSIRQYRKEA